MEHSFSIFASWLSLRLGRFHVFVGVCLLIAVWFLMAANMEHPDKLNTWCNNIISSLSLLVLLIMTNANNLAMMADKIQKAELIRAIPEASNELIRVDELTEDDMKVLKQRIIDVEHKPHVADATMKTERVKS